MSDFDLRLTNRMRDRIQEILVADGVQGSGALSEANSLVEGLGYYDRVKATTGILLSRAYDGIEVRGPGGDLIELLPFDRLAER